MSLLNELARRPAVEIRDLVATKKISPVEAVQAALDMIESLNPVINAVVTFNERALDDARALEQRIMRGEDPGPLCGLTAGIKDVTPVAGMRTTYGSPLFRDHIPDEDALVVQRLRQAGAVIIGKTNTPEFATGGNTFNEVYGHTCNPWDVTRSAGGSTGGGAAGLATGMISLAEGTDLGGSLRIPAAFCGIVGLRPSPGLVPTYPSDYLWDNMQVTGIMGRTAADIGLALDAVSGPSPLSPMSQPKGKVSLLSAAQSGIPRATRIAYVRDIAGIGIDTEVEKRCGDAARELRQAGAKVEEIEWDLSEYWKPFLHIRGFWMVAQQYPRLDQREAFGANLKGNVEAGLKVTMAQLGMAEHMRGRMWREFTDFFRRYDYLLTPCMAIPPFTVTDNYPETIAGKKMNTYIDWVAPTFILSLTGLPVGCVPCGLTADRLPVALQVVGPARGEAQVLGLTAIIQQLCPIGLPPLPGIQT